LQGEVSDAEETIANLNATITKMRGAARKPVSKVIMMSYAHKVMLIYDSVLLMILTMTNKRFLWTEISLNSPS